MAMPAVRRSRLLVAGVGVALALAQLSLPVLAQGTASPSSEAVGAAGPAPCFFRQEWTGGWKATPDARTIYISVSGSIYRLDLDTSYPLLQSPWAQLFDRDSSNTICKAIDFRLVVYDQIAIREAVIVRRLTRLTPAEAASLPKSLRP